MKLILATKNAHKVGEMREILRHLNAEILSLRDIGFDGEIVEDGDTFEANSLIKARAAAAAAPDCIAFADDSGIAVDALGGAPGIHSARYGGDACADDRARTDLLLKNMEGKTDRAAQFVCCIACVMPSGEEFVVRGECPGVLAEEYRGYGGFGYDPIFIPNGYTATMGEISAEEKNKISHRARALALFCEELERRTERSGK